MWMVHVRESNVSMNMDKPSSTVNSTTSALQTPSPSRPLVLASALSSPVPWTRVPSPVEYASDMSPSPAPGPSVRPSSLSMPTGLDELARPQKESTTLSSRLFIQDRSSSRVVARQRRAPLRSHNRESSVELAVPSPSLTDIMQQQFPHTDLRFASPMSSPALSPRSSAIHSIRSMPSSPSPTSPYSAAMLSSPAIDPVAPQQRRVESSNYSPQTLRHPLFYMQDNMIVLEVEGCLFKVHRYQLEWHSDYFCSLFKNQDDIDGHTDQLPLRIPSVTRRAFETLLHFLYFGVYNPENIFLHEWIILLSISTQLQFMKIRRYAIREVSAQQASLDPIKAIVLATNYDVPEWLAPAYAELCQRCRPLDEEEAEQLGARTTARLCRAREVLREKTFNMFQHRRYGVQYSAPEHYDGELVQRVVEDSFLQDRKSYCKNSDG